MILREVRKLSYTVTSIAVILFINLSLYAVSSFGFFKVIQYQILYFVLFSLLLTIFLVEKEKKIDRYLTLIMYMITAFVLLLVNSTGWFHSPFYFMLYLLVVVQSMFFVASVPIVQVYLLLMRVALSSTDISAQDFLTIISLLTIIPISFYVRENYLAYKESQKKILILESPHDRYQDSVEEVLDNRVHRFAAHLREFLSNIKMTVLHFNGTDQQRQQEAEKELVKQSDMALKLIKDFEEEVTGTLLMTTVKPSQDTQLNTKG